MPVNPMTMASWVQKTPEVCGGDARIRNTRHSVWGLVEWRKLGLSDDKILEHQPDLTPEVRQRSPLHPAQLIAADEDLALARPFLPDQ